jgi:adenylate cyclase class IV
MARNIEIKARIASVESLASKVAPLADAGPTAIAQDDTFFHCAHGRLKIAYERSDTSGPKLSDYVRAPVANPAALREALTRACGLRGRVIKQRTLYLIGPTRVHLDVVAGLGHFMELEVVLRDEQSLAQGEAIAQQLLTTLGIQTDQLLSQAYIDLLEQQRS